MLLRHKSNAIKMQKQYYYTVKTKLLWSYKIQYKSLSFWNLF